MSQTRGSAANNQFNHDFAVTINTTDPAAANSTYNYQDAADLLAAGKIWVDNGELPGLSVLWRDGERCFTPTPPTNAASTT
jgi:predicted dithiol-disulfide oxidoreductase (DUF899 family)